MAKIVLIAVVILGVLVVSRPLRAIVFHVRVRQFVTIFFVMIILSLIAGLGYAGWKYWWPMYMKQPTMQWTDTTLEHDEAPVTPGAGGPVKPTQIQIR